MVERELTSVAHYGWRDWLIQRVTAVVMLVYTIFFLAVLAALPARDYDTWQALWQVPVMRFATLFFVISMLLHAWVGVRNIFMDYVKDTGVRLLLYVLVILTLIAYGAWAWQILWGVY
ncbi:MAG TPA: succinate dehydrogenase, hydrophobic membrane anchor protein [Burkholderiales bacterium]|nr:succinate dehydrogenase, hydrophobic membrane anchor protein [Burkholderiales bacterium]